MKKTQVLTTLKIAIAAILLFVSILIITDANPTRGLSFARAADSQCGNKYTDSSRCTNPPASVECSVSCDANGENPKANCQSCPKPESTSKKTCNEYWDAAYCPDGQQKKCTVKCDTCTGTTGTNCSQTCGGCEAHGTNPTAAPGGGGPTEIPKGGDYVAPTAPPDIPAGKNCKVTSSGSCGSADFYGYTPGEGKMACCKGTAVGDYGTASDCDANTCSTGNGSICDRHPEGGTFKEGTCQNPVNCPRRITPQPGQPTATPVPCEEKVKGQYCEQKNCHWYNTIYNTCTNQDVRYEDTGANCCSQSGPTPTPPPKKEPTPKTPGSNPVCDGLEVTYRDPNNAQQTILSNDYQRVIEVYPGSNVTFNRLHLSNGQYTPGMGIPFNITCLLTSPATCTVADLVAKARAAGYPKALPQTIPASQNPDETGQFNGVLTAAEDASPNGACAVRIKSKPVVPGSCTSLSVTLEKGGSVNVNSATANNVLPRVPEPGEKMTLNSTAGPGSQFTIYWIRPLNAPQDWDPASNAYSKASGCAFYILNPDGQPPAVEGSFTMPDWKGGQLRRNDTYGKQSCADTPINFDAGVIFGVNYLPQNVPYSDANWCRNAGPNTTDAILHHGSTNTGQKCDNVCVAQAKPAVQPTKTPQQTTCSEECDDQTAPCGTGLKCIPADNGKKYCSKPELEQSCKTSPSQTSCCTEASPTPSPTPAPNECGYTPCDEQTAPCKEGLTCIEADNGKKYCSKPQLTEQCGENPSQTSCCVETTPTPIPTKVPQSTPTPVPAKCGYPCGQDNGAECAEGMTCVNTPNGYLCAMDKYQNACSEAGSYNACCTEPTPTPAPTYTPQPTPTQYPTPSPYPTYTPLPPPPVQQVIQQQQQQQPQVQYVQQVQPTYTPVPPPPTYTVIPTFTPFPTQPPQATYTPVPPPPVSGSAVPFVVAGVPIVLLILGMLL